MFGKIMMQRKTYWAIALNPEFIEIREAKKKPRAVQTECERDSLRTEYEGYLDAAERWRVKRQKVPFKFTIKNTVHLGGRAMKVITSRVFWGYTHQSIPVGECLRLTATQAARILRKEKQV